MNKVKEDVVSVREEEAAGSMETVDSLWRTTRRTAKSRRRLCP